MVGNGKLDLARITSGLVAVLLSCWYLIQWQGSPTIILASLFFLVICITDTLFEKIHNLTNLALVLAGVTYHGYTGGLSGIGESLLGLTVGLALLLGPYFFGGMGAGDVKALAALGALLGPEPVFQVFLYMALFGGLLGIVHYLMNCELGRQIAAGTKALRTFSLTLKMEDLKPAAQTHRLRFPYAAAIAFGFFAYIAWGGLL